MHLNVENDNYMYLHVYKPQEYFLQPISDLQRELGLLFSLVKLWLSFFLVNFSPRKGFEIIINKQDNIFKLNCKWWSI